MQVGFTLFVKNVLHGDSLQFSYLEASVGGGMAIGAVIVGLKILIVDAVYFVLS